MMRSDVSRENCERITQAPEVEHYPIHLFNNWPPVLIVLSFFFFFLFFSFVQKEGIIRIFFNVKEFIMDNEPIVADCGNDPRNCNLFPGGGGGEGAPEAPPYISQMLMR